MKLLNKFKTNWTLTTKFLLTLVFIIIMNLFFNIVVCSQFLIYTKKTILTLNPQKFTYNFSEYVKFKNSLPFINETGKSKILKNHLWVQMIDENFSEVYSFNKPQKVPVKYIPIQFSHMYKYDIAGYSVFVSEKSFHGKSFSYIIGFPENTTGKYTLIFNTRNIKLFFWNGVLLVLSLNILATVLSAYFLFGKKMGIPLQKIINSINNLSNGKYKIQHVNSGVYKNIFSNLDNLNENLKEAKEKREELEKIRNTWISSISHDVKTPLSSIKGYAEIMKDVDYSFSEEEIRTYAEIIYKKSSYIQSLVDDLNMTYKLKNNAVPLKKEKVNIVPFVQNIIVEILNHPLYSEENIEFYCRNQVMETFIDKKLMKRAIDNLIINAVVHNESKTKVVVSIYENKSINIIIKDYGKGISKNDLKHIFNRYYRGTNTNSSIQGSGLGMAISKQIIDAHEGTICVDSALEHGTTVNITLKT